jgi:DNA-binding CsgD family transcriptional regulator
MEDVVVFCGRKITRNDFDYALILEAGTNYVEIAEKYNISQQMVSKNLKNNIKILKGITKEWL